MSQTIYPKKPPLWRKGMDPREYLKAIRDWMLSPQEIHGDTNRDGWADRIFREEDIDGFLRVGKEAGLTVEEIGETILSEDCVRSSIEVQLRNRGGRKAMEKRVAEYKKRRIRD